MKKSIIILLTFCSILFATDAFSQNYSKRARQERKKNFLKSNAKSAFKPSSKSLYAPGSLSMGIFGNHYGSNTLAGITGEYYFSDKMYLSSNLMFQNYALFEADKKLFSLGAEGNYHFHSVNNTLFFTGFGGVAIARQLVTGYEPSVPSNEFVINGMIGIETMMHLLYNLSIYTDIRNSFAINEKNNRTWLWALGIKYKIL